MHVGASIRKRCTNCQVIRRRNGKGKPNLLIVCENPRHKQRQG